MQSSLKIHLKSITYQPVLSCHKYRFKHLNLQYIYPISYKIAKKANPEKGFSQIEIRYHNLNLIPVTERYIAELTRLAQVVISYYGITEKSVT